MLMGVVAQALVVLVQDSKQIVWVIVLGEVRTS
jgi:hypothetical protein